MPCILAVDLALSVCTNAFLVLHLVSTSLRIIASIMFLFRVLYCHVKWYSVCIKSTEAL